jgi:hypothetical protein
LVNEYLGYLADRNYSPRTGRAYGYDLLAFCRWLLDENLTLEMVTTEVLLDYLRSCREASVPGRPGNVVSLSGVRADRYAPSTINHRLVAVAGLFVPDDARSDRTQSGAQGSGGPAGHRGGTQRHVGASGRPAEAALGVAVA